jgi:hypothetical protein
VEQRLRKFAKGPVPESRKVDELVFAEAGRRMRDIRTRRIRRRIGIISGGVSAVAALVLVLWMIPRGPHESGRALVHGDYNGDGVFDVLDAFSLAREIDDGGQPSLEWDATKDGLLDEADVQAWMQQVVSLSEGDAS